MRIISWNIRRNPSAIDHAFDSLGADVLLAQECNVLSVGELHSVGSFTDERWVKHKWGNVTFSRSPLKGIAINTEYRGSLTLASLQGDFGQLGLINIYGLFEPVIQGSRKKLANPGIHRRLSDLSPLLYGHTPYDFDGFLMMGDLNHDRRMDGHRNFRRSGAYPAERLFGRIEDFQMTDLLKREFPDGIQTYRSVRGNFPWQLDHAFASNKLAERLKIQVVSDAVIEELSDHNPVVLDIR